MKVVKRILFVMALMLMFIPNVMAKSNPYPKTYDPGTGTQIVNCTWYVWDETKKRTGIELPTWYNVWTWYSKAKKAGFSVGSEPKANSIFVLDYSKVFGEDIKMGHVGYVTSVDGDTITYDEAGNAFVGNGISLQNKGTLEDLKIMGLVGFIYLDEPIQTTTTTTKKSTTKTTTTTETTTTTTTTETTTTTSTTTSTETTTTKVSTTAKEKETKESQKNDIIPYLIGTTFLLIIILSISLILIIRKEK